MQRPYPKVNPRDGVETIDSICSHTPVQGQIVNTGFTPIPDKRLWDYALSITGDWFSCYSWPVSGGYSHRVEVRRYDTPETGRKRITVKNLPDPIYEKLFPLPYTPQF